MDIIFVSALNLSEMVNSPQLGQLILQNILKNNYHTELVNFDFLHQSGELLYTNNVDEIILNSANYLIRKDAKIISFYTMCDSFILSIQIAEKVKQLNDNIKIILGGPHASLLAAECIESFEFVSLVAIGEGENTIYPIVRALLEGKSLENVKGIAYRTAIGKTFINEPEKLLSNVELSMHTPFDYAPFKLDSNSNVSIEGGRGCPYGCTFCSTSIFWGRKFRVKTVDNLIGEMNKFHFFYGVTDFYIVHDMFTAKKEHIFEFCDKLRKNNIKYTWQCSTRVDSINEDLLDSMSKAGCTNIFLGIETGSSRMQKLINKNLNLTKINEKIDMGGRFNLKFQASFVYCYPSETINDFKDTLHLIKELLVKDNCALQLHKFMPLPKTIETENIRDSLFLREDELGLSLYEPIPLNEKSIELMRKYPDLFTQHYSYPSSIYDCYTHIDILIYALDTVSSAFSVCLKIILSKYSIEEIYFKYKDELLDFSKELKELNHIEKMKWNRMVKRLSKFGIMILSNIVDNGHSNIFKELFYFEQKLFDILNNNDVINEIVLHLPFDYLESRRTLKVTRDNTYVSISIHNKKIRLSIIDENYFELKRLLSSNESS